MKYLLILCLSFSLNLFSQQLDFLNYYHIFNESMGDDLIVASDGNYLFTGCTFYHNGPQQPFLYKLDQGGNVIWSKLSNEMGVCYPGLVIETKSNKYLTIENFIHQSIIKMSDSSGTELWTTKFNFGRRIFSALEIGNCIYCLGTYEDNFNHTFGFMYKTNEAGDTLQQFDSLICNFDFEKSCYKISNNNIVFCSTAFDTVTNDYYPVLTEIDTNANMLWSKTFPSIHGQGKDVIVNNAGEYIILAETYDILFKTDSIGNIIWQIPLPAGYDFGLVKGSNNDIIIGTRSYLHKYDDNGILLDSISFPTTPEFYSFAVTDSSFAFAGSDYQSVYTSAFVLAYSDTSFILNVNDLLNSRFRIFPNPFQSSISILSAEKMSGSIQLMDLNGKVLIDQDIFDNVKLNTEMISDGLYIIVIKIGDNITRKKIIKTTNN